MKHLLFTLLTLLMLSCDAEVADETLQSHEEEAELTVCETNEIECTIEAGDITMNSTKSWFIYAKISETQYTAVLKWEYPGAPEWNGANSLSFDYDINTNLASGSEYEARNIIGVVEFDGHDGQMFGSIGDGSITIYIDDYNPEMGYICGRFEGQAPLNNGPLVDVVATFKVEID